MSLKPPKKGDLSKSWMRPRKCKKIITSPEYHLIVSEGTKTEPHYFEGLQREIYKKCGRNRIHIRIEGEGRNTLSLLERAQEYVRSSNNPIRHVWLVYDLDDFPHDDFDNTAHKCTELTSASQSRNSEEAVAYHALWSNQCIELWFLLHFEYLQADKHRSGYWQMLSAYLNKIAQGDYKKNREDIYEILRPYLDTAKKNAKKLVKDNTSNPPSKSAPGTNVYEIFDALSAYLA